MRKNRKKFICYFALAVLSPYPAYIFFQVFGNLVSGAIGKEIDWNVLRAYAAMQLQVVRGFALLVCLLGWYVMFMAFSPFQNMGQNKKMLRVTDKIFIPPAVGNGEYGTARFASYKEFKELESISTYRHGVDKKPQGGVVLGRKEEGGREEILYAADDMHVILIGATRCGKDRRIMFESVWLNILSGLNVLVFDPKGESYAYTSEFAKKNGYQVFTLDFRTPEYGDRYNYLQPVLDALEEGDTALAVDATWDLVSMLVSEQKGEAIWYNGECATIAATILIVALDAPKEYRNLTNVYYFLAMMVKTDDYGEMFFDKYLASKADTHPAKGVFAMARVAHYRTRGSFFSAALGTLKHFTNPKIADMTSSTDISFEELAGKKTIVYLIVPDEKKTLYPLAVLYLNQLYLKLTQIAISNGNRAPIDWYIFANEFGNYPVIPSFDSYITVGAGRGIRFVIAVQDYQQIERNYKDTYETIKGNCQVLIYLKSSSHKTNKEISEVLDNYTIQTNSASSNYNAQQPNGGSVGNSIQMTTRELLKPGEVGMMDKPYALVKLTGEYPIVLYTPDLSKYKANKELGLGSKRHNQRVINHMLNDREKRDIRPLELWGIWNKYDPAYEEPDTDSENTRFF